MRCCPHCHRVWVEESDFCPADGTPMLTLPEPGELGMPDPLRGLVLGGRYRLLEMLGAGGMGFVYVAEQRGLRRRVAVKMLYAERTRDPASLRRFAREAQALANLDHPGLVRVLDHGEGNLPYIAMELVEGEALDEVLERFGSLTPAQTVVVVRQLAEALQAAHERGITHRDLKPSNVHLVLKEGRLRVRILDFGLALMGERVAGASTTRLTRVGLVAGTPEYMAPEQVRGQDLDGRADLYALGVLLFECLTGEPPFFGGPPSLVVSRHLEEEVPPLPPIEGLDKAMHLRLGALVRRLMAKHRADRLRTGAEVAEILRGFEEQLGPPTGLAAITKPSDFPSSVGELRTTDIEPGGETPSDEWPEAASPGDVAYAPGSAPAMARPQTTTGDAAPRRDDESADALVAQAVRAERRRYNVTLGLIAAAAAATAAVVIPTSLEATDAPASATRAPVPAPAVASAELAVGGAGDGETDPQAVAISARPGGDAQGRYEERRRELERELAQRGLRFGDLRDVAQLRPGLQAIDRAVREGSFETATVALDALGTAVSRLPVQEVLEQRMSLVERQLRDDAEPVHHAAARAIRGSLTDATASALATRQLLRRIDDLERALR